MDEYGDIYYLDDTRNGPRERIQGGTVYAGHQRPVTARPARALVMQPAASVGYRPAYTPQGTMVYAPQSIAYGEPSPTAGALLGRLTITQIVEIAAQAFAALQSLPPPPNPAEETATNVQNLILYQTALAQHAKRDEQIRTLGALVAKLAG